MTQLKKEIDISAIAQRIRDEYRINKSIDWAHIAAVKIYNSYINKPVFSPKFDRSLGHI